MDINLLQIFLTVAKHKSISLGAIELNKAQSNVTARIKQLEKNLECKLFYRIPKGVILTPKGEELYPYAKQLVLKMEQMIKSIKSNQPLSLRIGSTESNAITRIMDFLSSFHSDLPEVKLELQTDTTWHTTQKLLNYEIDVAFISGKPKDETLEILNAIEEKLVIVESLSAGEDNFLSVKSGCSYRSLGEEFLQRDSSKKLKVIEFGTFETVLGCVELGMGKTVLPISLVKKLGYLNRVSILPMPKKYEKMPTYLVCRKDNIPACVEYLREFDFETI